MTLRETTAIMEILSTAYPRFYAGPNAPDQKQTAKLWADMFAEDDVKLVAAAVKALIATDEKGFPPHIGAIKAKIRQLVTPREMTEQEAWNRVYRAVCNSGYNAETEFSALPERLQRMVGSPNQLREWAAMDSDTVQSVIASNFQRSYRARVRSDREWEALPADIKAIAREAARKRTLPEENPSKPALSAQKARSQEEVQGALKKLREEFGGPRREEWRAQAQKISDEEIAKRREENLRRLREWGESP